MMSGTRITSLVFLLAVAQAAAAQMSGPQPCRCADGTGTWGPGRGAPSGREGTICAVPACPSTNPCFHAYLATAPCSFPSAPQYLPLPSCPPVEGNVTAEDAARLAWRVAPIVYMHPLEPYKLQASQLPEAGGPQPYWVPQPPATSPAGWRG